MRKLRRLALIHNTDGYMGSASEESKAESLKIMHDLRRFAFREEQKVGQVGK